MADTQTIKVTVDPKSIANDFTMEEIFQTIARKNGRIEENGEGIAFEVPINDVVKMVRRDLNTGYHRRVLVGIHPLDHRAVMHRVHSGPERHHSNDSVIVRADDLVKWMKS